VDKVQSINQPGNRTMMPSKIKKDEGSNRRKWPRLNPEDLPFLKNVEFSQGKEIQIVNISQGGLLLETEMRLRPDLNIVIKLVTTEGIFKMDGTILRSSIFSLKGVPKYRTAIAFHHPFRLLDYVKIEAKDQAQQASTDFMVPEVHEDSDSHPPQQKSPNNDTEKAPAILTVVASDASGVCLQESFKLNDW